MTTPSRLEKIDTMVQELRVEQHKAAFLHNLGLIVGALGAIPDSPPHEFTVEAMKRLRELVEETVEAIEQRIDSGGDRNKVQQELAATVYAVRRRMEAVEIWVRHYTSN
jgi:hypothetical protein